MIWATSGVWGWKGGNNTISRAMCKVEKVAFLQVFRGFQDGLSRPRLVVAGL